MDNLKFWAKTTPEGKPGIEVRFHTYNVGLVAGLIAASKQPLLNKFGLDISTPAIMAALHDIGKISPGFQSKSPHWLAINGLEQEAKLKGWHEDERSERRHDRVSQFTIFNVLCEKGMSAKHAAWWAMASGAHHGRPYNPDNLVWRQGEKDMRKDDWHAQRVKVLETLTKQLGDLPTANADQKMMWWLAGLISVADWIGSDERFFDNNRNPTDEESRCWAEQAVSSIGFTSPAIRRDLTFGQLFKLGDGEATPNDLQQQAFNVISRPGIYVIEAPMGMGKTEAALWAAYRLISEGHATGLYFALPTQVTSNRIHLRAEEFINNICEGQQRTRLIHANSWLIDTLSQPTLSATASTDKKGSDARTGRDWFASPKRALLAAFGVGTVDQTLMSILAVKHFFVRRFALAGKVVVIDEVHSYDVYTGSLVRCLCDELQALGCTVILLSATLTKPRRMELLGLDAVKDADANEAYPLITGKTTDQDNLIVQVASAPAEKLLHPSFHVEDEAIAAAYDKAKRGACVLWICNTVGKAQQIFRCFEEMKALGDPLKIGLLHSRYPFFQRELLENEWMERLGKSQQVRRGCILVATQVVEQSVDLDADLLVTDLAPTDMMLQRAGRLWRHNREWRPLGRAEMWIINPRKEFGAVLGMSAKAIEQVLKPSSNVYAPYVLLRSWQVWQQRTVVAIPSEIRELLKGTYDQPAEQEPEGWETLKGDIQGKEFAHKSLSDFNTLIWKPLGEDVEGKAKTRLDTQEMALLVLASDWDGKQAVLLNGERVDLSKEDYSVAVARALHKNIVKAPKWVLPDIQPEAMTQRYLFGDQRLAVVGKDGGVEVSGLKAGFRLRYTHQVGLIIQSVKNEGEDSESGL